MAGPVYATVTAEGFTAHIGAAFTSITHIPARRGRRAAPVFTGGQVTVRSAEFPALRQVVTDAAAHPFIAYREWDTARAYLSVYGETERAFADGEFSAITASGAVTVSGPLWHFGQLDVEHARIGDLAALLGRISLPIIPVRER